MAETKKAERLPNKFEACLPVLVLLGLIKVYPLSRTFLSNRQTVTVTFPADNFLFPIGCMK